MTSAILKVQPSLLSEFKQSLSHLDCLKIKSKMKARDGLGYAEHLPNLWGPGF